MPPTCEVCHRQTSQVGGPTPNGTTYWCPKCGTLYFANARGKPAGRMMPTNTSDVFYGHVVLTPAALASKGA